MASLSFTHSLSLPRWDSTLARCPSLLNFVRLQDFRLQNKWGLAAISRKKIAENSEEEKPSENGVAVEKKTTRTSKRATSRTRKKPVEDTLEENSELVVKDGASDEESVLSTSSEDSKKTPRRTRRKAASASSSLEEEVPEKVSRRRRRKIKKTDDNVRDEYSESEMSDLEESAYGSNMEEESDLDIDLDKDDGDDISYTYGWPPLVCCFGAAQHAFVPSGRPANRLIDHEIHERMKDAFYDPENFIRAPGGSASSVSVALASLGGKVAFMGKLGDDEYGEAMLYYLNENNVQTRSVCIDSRRPTALSKMKIAKRGRLRLTCIKPCAEDSISKSDINIDVLKETKMFYFNSHSLLDRSMESATLRAINIAKKLGAIIFYDVNLPLPLWHSSEETKSFVEQMWNLADIIEITKQELEFLCGIEPTEEFDTKNNDFSKFSHYGPEVISPLWHENLQVLFVTNGTSKIHYYTKEHNGAVLGMEDAPLSPFSKDMSAAGDGIVAALMRMLTVQPHLITDKEYLVHSIKYAIDCGVIDQWIQGRQRGFPPKEDMEEEEVEPDENCIRSITHREYRTVMSVAD